MRNAARPRSTSVLGKLPWPAALLVLACLIGSISAGDPDYGEPSPPVYGHPRPYSQRSFRNYYLHRIVEQHRRPSVESYPTFEIDVTPTYGVTPFPCPYAYPSQLYSLPRQY
jgi:hypothetical protein